jgi:beta-glucosidase
LHLAAGETGQVTFHLSARDLSRVNKKGEHVVAPGTYDIFVGGAQPAETSGGLRTEFEITDEAHLPR